VVVYGLYEVEGFEVFAFEFVDIDDQVFEYVEVGMWLVCLVLCVLEGLGCDEVGEF